MQSPAAVSAGTCPHGVLKMDHKQREPAGTCGDWDLTSYLLGSLIVSTGCYTIIFNPIIGTRWDNRAFSKIDKIDTLDKNLGGFLKVLKYVLWGTTSYQAHLYNISI